MATYGWTVSKQMMSATSGPANPGDLHIPLGLWAAGTGWNGRAVLYAPINFTGMTSINQAILYMAGHGAAGYHANGGGVTEVLAYRKLTDWSEGSHGQSSAVDEVWGGDGSSVVNDNIQDHMVGDGLSGLGAISEGAWYGLDITNIARMWLQGYPNYGVALINPLSESSGAFYGKEFYSRHMSGYQPYMWINYNTNNPPNAPVNLSPTNSNIVNSGTSVGFSGTFSDPDPGDSLSGVRIEIWNDAETVRHTEYYWNTSGTSFARTLSHPQGNAYYKWRARNNDSQGAVGPFSAFQRYFVNTPPTPPTGSIVQTPLNSLKTLTPTFQITHNDADSPQGDSMGGYQIHLYLGPDSTGTLVWDSGAIATAAGTITASKVYNGPALSWGTTYSWFPKTYDRQGAWSNWNYGLATFTTYKTGTPISLAPTGSTVVGSLTPTFTASRATTDYTISQYSIEVYESNGTTLKWSTTGQTSGITNGASISRAYGGAALSYSTAYKWRIQFLGNIGGWSDWSALQDFQTPSSTAATQTAPVGSPVTSLTPNFTGAWNENLNAVQILVYEANGTTLKWDSGTLTQTSATTYSKAYAGPALAWNTTYQWQVRVRRSADNLFQPYTGKVSFTTDSAGQPTLTAPIDNSWQTTITPTFTGTTFNAEVISTYRIRLYESDGTTLTWDSGDIAGSGTSFSGVYNGANELVRGRTYKWQARYIKSTGPTGNYSALEDFHINALPQEPSSLIPGTGAVVVDTLVPTFTASFADPDASLWSDYPTVMEIEVRNNNTDALIATQTKNTGLLAGANSMVWDGTPALAYETTYKWRVRYTDSKSQVGAWSSYNVFKPSQSSSVTLTGPGSTITSPQVPVTWNFSSPAGKSQASYRVRVMRNSDDLQMYDSGTILSSSNNHLIPAGFLVNNTEYTFEVTTVDTDGI